MAAVSRSLEVRRQQGVEIGQRNFVAASLRVFTAVPSLCVLMFIEG